MIYNPKNNIEVELKKLTAYPAVESASIINDKWPNNYFEFIDKLGDIYLKDKKFLDASACYKLTLESPTIMKEIYFKLANTLFLHGNYEESYYYAKKMYELFPCNIDYTRLYIEIILIIGEVQEFDNLSKKLFEENPKNDDYKFFLAQSKRLLGDFNGSRKLLEQLENDTNNIKYSFALADTIGELDTLTAINCYEKIISKGAKLSAIQKFNLSIHYLRNRNFKKGWEYFEFGLDKTIGKRGRKLPYNFKGTYRISNDNEINKKDKILVCSEQGIGDQILFYSVLNNATNESLNLFVICEERMETILKRSFPLISFSSSGNFISSNLKQMLSNEQLAYFPLATLYSRYRPNIDKISNNNKAYIIPNATLKAQFRTHLDYIAKGRRIIGICWKSFVDNNISIIKNIDFLNWLTLFTRENLIINLQYGNSLDEQQLLNNLNLEMISFNEIDFKQDLDSWLSLSCACDGVISVSSSIVHFAGSTGQKVSVIMPFKQGHWSLGLSDKESIFYPNVRIFRVGERITETSIILDAFSYIKG